MALTIANWFLQVFHSSYLSVFLISIIPMIEVRGAIPIGVSMGMDIWVSYVFATLSALVIAPILILILKPILKWLKTTKVFKKIAVAVEDMFSARAGKIEKKLVDAQGNALTGKEMDAAKRKNFWKKMLGVFAFVAIPLPLTGVWTGTAVAVFLNLKWYQILPPIVIGNFVAGAIITALTVALGDKVSIILYVLFAFVLISLAVMLIGMYQRSKKKKAAAAERAASDPNEKDGTEEK